MVVAKDVTARFLAETGVVEPSDLPGDWKQPSPERQRVVEVTHAIATKRGNYTPVRHFDGQELIAKAVPNLAARRIHLCGPTPMIDAFSGKGIPEELMTVEFFRDLKALSGHTTANMIMDTALESSFARNLLATYRTAFGRAWVKRVQTGERETSNFLVTNWAAAGSSEWTGDGAIYTDDRNTSDRDRVRMLWGSE